MACERCGNVISKEDLERSRHDDIASGLAGLTAEVRSYVARHDLQHDELVKQHDCLRDEHHEEEDELRELIGLNTSWRVERQAWEKLGRWVVGSNVAVLIGLAVAVAMLLRA